MEWSKMLKIEYFKNGEKVSLETKKSWNKPQRLDFEKLPFSSWGNVQGYLLISIVYFNWENWFEFDVKVKLSILNILFLAFGR